VAAAQQAPACEAAPQAAGVSAADGASERDLTYEEVVFKLNMLTKSAVVATLVCGGIVLFNSRVLFGWQKGRRGKYDADAFQRAFARFLNEKGWEREAPSGYQDRSQRAQKMKRENDRFWQDFHAREQEMRDRQERFRRQQEEFGRRHGAGQRRREYDGRWGYKAGQEHERGGASSRSGAQVEAALARLQIPKTASQFAATGLSVKELKTAYIKAAKKWHPDGKEDKDKAHYEQEFKLVSAAYTLLRPMCSKT